MPEPDLHRVLRAQIDALALLICGEPGESVRDVVEVINARLCDELPEREATLVLTAIVKRKVRFEQGQCGDLEILSRRTIQ